MSSDKTPTKCVFVWSLKRKNKRQSDAFWVYSKMSKSAVFSLVISRGLTPPFDNSSLVGGYHAGAGKRKHSCLCCYRPFESPFSLLLNKIKKQAMPVVISRGLEPLIPPWKGGVLTTWPRDQIFIAFKV